MTPADLVQRFLSSVGREAEARYYLSLFRGQQAERFATICVEPSALESATGALVVDLRFLVQLGLFPVLVFQDKEHAERVRDRLQGALPVELTDAATSKSVACAGRIPFVAMTAKEIPSLVAQLASRKVVFLGLRSGLLRADGRVPPLVDVTREYDALMAPGELAPEQSAMLARAKDIIDSRDGQVHVAITSPLDLLRELFTVRGAGTLVRRGAHIAVRNAYAPDDPQKLSELMTSAFGRAPADDFFSRPIESLLIADDFRGAAILIASPYGAYLSKFAVDVRAQGEGIGRDLWCALADETPLLWRARAQNPINGWYVSQCEGMLRKGEWNFYWRGLGAADIPQALAFAESQPVDF